MVRKHPDVIAKGKKIDMTDLEQDPFVMFQKKWVMPRMWNPIAWLGLWFSVTIICVFVTEQLLQNCIHDGGNVVADGRAARLVGRNAVERIFRVFPIQVDRNPELDLAGEQCRTFIRQ